MPLKMNDIVLVKKPIPDFPKTKPGMIGTIADRGRCKGYAWLEVIHQGKTIDVVLIHEDMVSLLWRDGKWVSKEAREIFERSESSCQTL